MSAMDAARRYVAAWNARNATRLAESFRPGGTYEDPNTGGPIEAGPLGHYAGSLWAAFPDLTFEELGYGETAPGEIVFRWVMRGTNRGSLRGLPPTGATIALPGADFITACDDGLQRVEGFFDGATLMRQLGVQVQVQPYAVGPVQFGVCTSVRSESMAAPGAVSLTMIDARTDDEVQQIRDTSRQIMLQLRGMPGFLSFQGAVIGRRLTTVTLWESREAQRQVTREATHKHAAADMFAGPVGSAFHASAWTLERMGELWMRCEACGKLRDRRAQDECLCGAAAVRRPAFW
jgi:predicted ester cyclase/heme-degrading monooxygenase HmoA